MQWMSVIPSRQPGRAGLAGHSLEDETRSCFKTSPDPHRDGRSFGVEAIFIHVLVYISNLSLFLYLVFACAFWFNENMGFFLSLLLDV